jgi:cytochrome c-type biogenesis protein
VATAVTPASGWWARHSNLAAVCAMLIALTLSLSWLAFPYFVQGKKVLFQVGSNVKQGQRVKAATIGRFLTRGADGPGEAEVEVLYATPAYFEISDRAGVVGKYQPTRYLVFIVTETTHVDRLPDELPNAVLVTGGAESRPISVEGPEFAEHHRTTVYQFARPAGYNEADAGELKIRLRNRWDGADTERSAKWLLPLDYPPELLERKGFTPTMVLALAAGLLSAVLTPCLLQLVVIYLVTLTGLGAAQLAQKAGVPLDAARRMRVFALAFVCGFTALFTLAGAVIGYAGKEVQIVLAEHSRSVGVVAGAMMIFMGLWVGWRARAPLVCRLPVAQRMPASERQGVVGTALMAAGFSLGCMTCFSGAIIATMFVYVGALGSAWVGAGVLLMFSLGIAVPFLAAAHYLTRVLPAMQLLARHTAVLGFVSMLVIMAFGVVLMTDNFHVLSDAIYPLLGLS